jgi:hypothetical protein
VVGESGVSPVDAIVGAGTVVVLVVFLGVVVVHVAPASVFFFTKRLLYFGIRHRHGRFLLSGAGIGRSLLVADGRLLAATFSSSRPPRETATVGLSTFDSNGNHHHDHHHHHHHT